MGLSITIDKLRVFINKTLSTQSLINQLTIKRVDLSISLDSRLDTCQSGYRPPWTPSSSLLLLWRKNCEPVSVWNASLPHPLPPYGHPQNNRTHRRRLCLPWPRPCRQSCSCRVVSGHSSHCEFFSCQSLKLFWRFNFVLFLSMILEFRQSWCIERGKLVIGSHVSSLSRGKSRHPIRILTSFCVIRLSLTSRTKYCVLLFDFSKTFVTVRVVWDFSLTDSPMTTHMLGHLGLFVCFTLSHTPFRTLCRLSWHHNSLPPVFLHLVLLKKKTSNYLSEITSWRTRTDSPK